MTDLGSVIIRDLFANRPTAGINGRLFIASDTGAIYRDNKATWDAIYTSPLNQFVPRYILIRDEKAQNTSGGTFTSSAWRTRDLNTEVNDDGGDASIATNQITLAAGTYICDIICPACQVDFHKARLYNITDGAIVPNMESTTDVANSAHAVASHVHIRGKFTLATSKVLEVQHYCGTSRATYGFGYAGNIDKEIYTIVQLWRVA